MSYEEMFDALAVTGGLELLYAGILLQFAFATVALLGAALLFRGKVAAARPIIAVGLFAFIISLGVFGGLIGMIGGLLSVWAGWTAP